MGNRKRQDEKRGEKDKEKGEKKVKAEALEFIGRIPATSLPRLVVFDLDYTLWPFYSECNTKRDAVALYPEARGIIASLNEKGIDMAIASCSSADNTVKSLPEKFDIHSIFVTKEVFTSSCHKKEHFKKIQQSTGVAYKFMLFFDDSPANIDTVSKMGVSCTLVKKDGFDLETFRLGLQNFAANSKS